MTKAEKFIYEVKRNIQKFGFCIPETSAEGFTKNLARTALKIAEKNLKYSLQDLKLFKDEKHYEKMIDNAMVLKAMLITWDNVKKW